MGEEVPQRDAITEPRKLWEVFHHRVVVGKLPALGQDHDRHRRELLRHRRQAEGGLGSDRNLALEVGKAVTTCMDDLPVADDRDCGAGRIADRVRFKKCVDLRSGIGAADGGGATPAATDQRDAENRGENMTDDPPVLVAMIPCPLPGRLMLFLR